MQKTISYQLQIQTTWNKSWHLSNAGKNTFSDIEEAERAAKAIIWAKFAYNAKIIKITTITEDVEVIKEIANGKPD